MGKEIQVATLEVGDLKFGFGNPRNITQKKKDDLQQSLETFGDFGLFLIDENNNVIGGTQRAKVLKSIDPHTIVTCKRLIGYTEAEKRAINIRDNTHAGEWDLDLLAEWTADLNIDLGIDLDNKTLGDGNVDGMDLIHYEKYDYVLIACRNEVDYLHLIRALGIENKKVPICKKRSIKARAIWYDQMKAKIVSEEELAERNNND